jgi:branched-chain amino acid transport system ATP-binding protein
MQSILSLHQVSKKFGSIVVADEVTFDVSRGECVGILGPNGAGKTSLLGLISGLLAADSGKITLNSTDITPFNPASRCRLGIGRAFQVPRPFHNMSVVENVLVAVAFGQNMSELRAKKEAGHILELTGLEKLANRKSGGLPLLDRKRLEFARALATNPAIILLDEIAGGLTDGEWSELVESIKLIKQRGVTIIWIEHVVHALMSVADRLIVINFGKVVADGDPANVMASDLVKQIYLGMEVG